jgi:spermidine synthase
MRRKTRLLAIESQFPEAHSMLRLLEPPGSCQNTLWGRLFDGTYDKPFIIDSGVRRFLHFDLSNVQSAMRLDDPERLSLRYTRKMMAFLLFNRAPERILFLGLGGGSLAKFCYRRLPRAALTAVEVNRDVIALREEFCIPADDARFRVIWADGVTYMTRLKRSKDVILADACDRAGVAREFDAIEFYQNAHRCLSPEGVFVTNMCSDIDGCFSHLTKIRAVFGDEFMTLQVRPNGNVIVFAFKEHPHPEIDWERLGTVAVALKRSFGLDFPNYVRRLALDCKLRRWGAGIRMNGCAASEGESNRP